jgi:UDP-3-O-[3-hydroxymyristoyl] glucosamine N-acyltransferase
VRRHDRDPSDPRARRGGPGDLTFLANPKYAPQLAATRASAAIVAKDAAELPIATLRADNPYLCFARRSRCFTARSVRRGHPPDGRRRAERARSPSRSRSARTP